jgi:hypothetical protein
MLIKIAATMPHSKSVLKPLRKNTTVLLGDGFEGLVSTVRIDESDDGERWQLILVTLSEEIEANYFSVSSI